jgi:hypothetical protein
MGRTCSALREIRKAHKILVGEPAKKRLLRRPR